MGVPLGKPGEEGTFIGGSEDGQRGLRKLSVSLWDLCERNVEGGSFTGDREGSVGRLWNGHLQDDQKVSVHLMTTTHVYLISLLGSI
jgi:hypothetical protein